ncbi:MAG: hypothetical protein OXE48_01865 [Gammaproteobacteria bacterium]|nr:hypothetical protein [Gammaproteobacteria bacterium]
MNKFLAGAMGAINSFVAWALIIGVPLMAGIAYGFSGFLVGLLLGALLAIVLCGALALLIDIRNALRKIAETAPDTR